MTRRPPPLLRTLGRRVRARRRDAGLTLRELAERSGLSQRFLVQVEQGEGNPSVLRLDALASALGTTASELLAPGAVASGEIVALVGLRGAGKSAVGKLVAQRLAIPFVELDALVERAAGMRLAAIFELHGEAWYRRLEREVLLGFLDRANDAVLATGGSLVQDPETWALLRARATTVWLRARPEDHWQRVVAQGDARPMANRQDAMAELRGILRAREPLYAEAAHVVDTSALGLDGSVEAVCALAAAGT
jgi:XRE family aerobic/anaerobic benzoate catabolism transcriptional regulator